MHCERVSGADGRKMTLKSEFSEFAKEQCSSGVRQNEFGLWGFFLELIFLVEWLLIAPVGCLNFGGIFGAV